MLFNLCTIIAVSVSLWQNSSNDSTVTHLALLYRGISNTQANMVQGERHCSKVTPFLALVANWGTNTPHGSVFIFTIATLYHFSPVEDSYM